MLRPSFRLVRTRRAAIARIAQGTTPLAYALSATFFVVRRNCDESRLLLMMPKMTRRIVRAASAPPRVPPVRFGRGVNANMSPVFWVTDKSSERTLTHLILTQPDAPWLVAEVVLGPDREVLVPGAVLRLLEEGLEQPYVLRVVEAVLAQAPFRKSPESVKPELAQRYVTCRS